MRVEMHVGLHGNNPLYLSDVNANWIDSTILEFREISPNFKLLEEPFSNSRFMCLQIDRAIWKGDPQGFRGNGEQNGKERKKERKKKEGKKERKKERKKEKRKKEEGKKGKEKRKKERKKKERKKKERKKEKKKERKKERTA